MTTMRITLGWEYGILWESNPLCNTIEPTPEWWPGLPLDQVKDIATSEATCKGECRIVRRLVSVNHEEVE